MSSLKLKPSDRQSIDFAEQERLKRKNSTNNNFAALDEKGNIKDSGKNANSFESKNIIELLWENASPNSEFAA